MSDDYTPIDCSLHDRLESFATMRSTVRIEWRDDTGATRETRDTIIDVYASRGAEFVRTRSGETIRLDRIIAVAGMRFDRASPMRQRGRSTRSRDEAGT